MGNHAWNSGRRACGSVGLRRTLRPGGKQKYLNKSTGRILYRGREKILLLDLKNQRNWGIAEYSEGR